MLTILAIDERLKDEVQQIDRRCVRRSKLSKVLPTSILATLFSVTLASSASAQAPDPDSIYVTSISYEGSGCPQGAVGQSYAGDRKTFTLIFDQFVASAGPLVPSTEAKKDCELTLMLNVPSTFRGGEITFDYRGYSALSAGQTASQKRKYSSSKTSATSALVGSIARDYRHTDPVAFTKVKSCDGTPCLVAKIKLALQKSDTNNQQVTIDSIDGAVTVSN